MKRATLVHFINKFDSVLLAMQQAKVIGRKGYGGKIEDGQTEIACTVEEVTDETGGNPEKRINPKEKGGIIFNPNDLVPVAVIDFYNGTEEEVPFGNPSWRVKFFNCYKFSGKAIDTIEMQDAWFYPIGGDNLPLDEVPKGDELFLKDILQRKLRKGWIRRTSVSGPVIDWDINPCTLEDLVI